MDWRNVAETVGKVAPVLGGALYGPAGSAVAGIVASVLGVGGTPEEVAEALRGDPEAFTKLRRLETDHEREILSLTLQAETAQLTQVNETMRAELQAEGLFKSGWRPGMGWVLTLSLALLSFAMVAAIFRDPMLVNDANFTGLLVWLIATMGAVLGINVTKRSDDKARLMGHAPTSFMGSIAAKVRK